MATALEPYAPPAGRTDHGAAGRIRPLAGYGLAVSTALAACGLRLLLDPLLPPGFPFLTFFPAVILTAYLAGVGSGIACAVLSGMAALYLFIPPAGSFALGYQSFAALGFYGAVVAVDIALIHLMRQATDRLAAQREVTAGLLRQQRLMFQELQHRVANNMTFVAGLLALHRRAVVADPAAAGAVLDEASARLSTMSRIHRRLYDPASVPLPVGPYFREMCDDLLEATSTRGITVLVDMPEIGLEIARLMTLSLLVTELVTNSLKHAFVGRPGGTITLRLERLDRDRLALTVSDDGRGLPREPGPAPRTAGLGTRITEGLARQLGGTLSVTSDSGTATRLVFRAD